MSKKVIEESEIKKLALMGRQLTSGVVLKTLIATIKYDIPAGTNLAEVHMLEYELAKYIETDPVNRDIPIVFKEIEPVLRITLDLVPSTYIADISCPIAEDDPDKNKTAVYNCYNLLRHIACGFWEDFKSRHSELFERVQRCRPDIKFDTLLIDPKHLTTMFFDERCDIRVGICSYWMDLEGRAFGREGPQK